MQHDLLIKNSEWWNVAKHYPDRHFSVDSKISLADHLDEVRKGVDVLLNSNTTNAFIIEINKIIAAFDLKLDFVYTILSAAALLHDIGKPYDDKWQIVTYPKLANVKKPKHEYFGELIVKEILPDSLPEKQIITNLVVLHDKPYRWYKEHNYRNFIPTIKDWLEMDEKIFNEANGTGLILLILFKLIDTHGHFHLNDVHWFINTANNSYLRIFNVHFPETNDEIIRSIVNSGF